MKTKVAAPAFFIIMIIIINIVDIMNFIVIICVSKMLTQVFIKQN